MDYGDPRVAVVMITHNRRDEVLATLGRLVSLPERPPIVMVDNASADGTPEAVASRFPQVEVISAGSNLGAAGRTLGVRHARAPYVALCDDDTWWDPGMLRRAADLFDAHPRLALITARVLVGPEEDEDPTCMLMAESPLQHEPGMPGAPLLGFLAGASMVRRSAFLEAGGFDPRFFIGGEERVLAADLAARGWWLCYVPELVVHHYPSNVRDAGSRSWLCVRNNLWSTWLRRPAGVVARQTLQALLMALRDGPSLRGLAAALPGLPWILRERRVVPPEVEYGFRLLEAQQRSQDQADSHVLPSRSPRRSPATADAVPHV